MRLIDAEHLKRWILARWEKTDPRSEYPLRAIDIIDQLDREDTIDAEPVRHGRWTVTYLKHIELANDEGHVYIHFAKCSECGNEAIMQFVDYNESFKEWYTDYCPHCGAKMDMED